MSKDVFEIQEDKWNSAHDDLNFSNMFTYKKIKTRKQVTY